LDPIEYLLEGTLSDDVAARVSNSVCHPVSRESLLSALIEVTGFELDKLAQLKLGFADTVSLYSKSTIAAFHIDVVGFIELDRDVVPLDVARERLDERVKHAGDIWLIHKNDADPFPSNPHAHNYETKLKLHLGNGGLYYKNDIRGNVGLKKLLLIREKVKFAPLPPLEIEA